MEIGFILKFWFGVGIQLEVGSWRLNPMIEDF